MIDHRTAAVRTAAVRSPRRVLVTGGAGFVGSRTVARLAARGDAPVVLDDGSAGMPIPSQAVAVPGDVRRPEDVERAFSFGPFDAVLHLAAIHHIPTCAAEPRRALDVNVIGTQTVLDAAARHGVGVVALASSGAVYAPVDGPLTETAPLAPVDTYALGKLANEHQLAVWSGRTGGRGRAARLFNVLGPGDPNAHLVPDILNRLAAAAPGETLVLPMGNIHTRRDYLHVDDAADGLIALLDEALRCAEPGFYAVNLCRGEERRTSWVAETVARFAGVAARIESRADLARSTDRPSQWGDPALALARLGWRAGHTPEEALAAAVRADGRFAVSSALADDPACDPA